MFNIFKKFCFSKFWSKTAKFIFITNLIDRRFLYNTYLFFRFVGATNYVSLLNAANGVIFQIMNPLDGEGFTSIEQLSIDVLFPNNLKDLHGYKYKLLAFDEHRKVIIENGTVRSKSMFLIDTIAKKQNAGHFLKAQLKWKEYNVSINYTEIYAQLFVRGIVDITPNTAIEYVLDDQETEKLMTFEETAYCAIVPMPDRISLFEILLTPYDSITWIMMIFSISVCAVLWWIFNIFHRQQSGNSAGRFTFGMTAVFLQQMIPFPGNIRMQVILMQICIFMIFILGNAYQSIITTMMTDARNGIRIKSFDELMKSDYNFKVDRQFLRKFETSEDYQLIKHKLTKSGGYFNDINYMEYRQNRTALIFRCDIAESELYKRNLSASASNHFYMIPERFYRYYEQLDVNLFSPFLQKMQEITDWTFVAGLAQEWQVMLGPKRNERLANEHAALENEEYLLKLSDLTEVFYLLLIGHAIALMVFIFELFWHKYGRIWTCTMKIKMLKSSKVPKIKQRATVDAL